MRVAETPEPIRLMQHTAHGPAELWVPGRLRSRFERLTDAIGQEDDMLPSFIGGAVMYDELLPEGDEELVRIARGLARADKELKMGPGMGVDVPLLALSGHSLQVGIARRRAELRIENVSSTIFEVARGSVPVQAMLRADIQTDTRNLSVWPKSGLDYADAELRFFPRDRVLTSANLDAAPQFGRQFLRAGVLAFGDEAVPVFLDAAMGKHPGSKDAAKHRRVAEQVYDVLDQAGFEHLP